MREFLAVRACRVRHSRPVAQHLQAFANVVSELHSATVKQGVVTRDQQLAENSLLRAYLALLTAAEMLEDCVGVAFPLLQWSDEFEACRELEAQDPRA